MRARIGIEPGIGALGLGKRRLGVCDRRNVVVHRLLALFGALLPGLSLLLCERLTSASLGLFLATLLLLTTALHLQATLLLALLLLALPLLGQTTLSGLDIKAAVFGALSADLAIAASVSAATCSPGHTAVAADFVAALGTPLRERRLGRTCLFALSLFLLCEASIVLTYARRAVLATVATTRCAGRNAALATQLHGAPGASLREAISLGGVDRTGIDVLLVSVVLTLLLPLVLRGVLTRTPAGGAVGARRTIALRAAAHGSSRNAAIGAGLLAAICTTARPGVVALLLTAFPADRCALVVVAYSLFTVAAARAATTVTHRDAFIATGLFAPGPAALVERGFRFWRVAENTKLLLAGVSKRVEVMMLRNRPLAAPLQPFCATCILCTRPKGAFESSADFVKTLEVFLISVAEFEENRIVARGIRLRKHLQRPADDKTSYRHR